MMNQFMIFGDNNKMMMKYAYPILILKIMDHLLLATKFKCLIILKNNLIALKFLTSEAKICLQTFQWMESNKTINDCDIFENFIKYLSINFN